MIPQAERSSIEDAVGDARLAGIGYVLIFALAIHANFALLGAVPSTGDAGSVLAFVRAHPATLRLAALEFSVVMAVDVVVALALYRLFQPAAPFVNAHSALFRLVYTTANIPVILGLVSALRWMRLDDPALAAVMTSEAIDGYGQGFTMTLGFFSIHLLLLGALILRTARIPRVIGLLVILAGAAYVWDAVAMLTLPELRAAIGAVGEMLVIVPALLGEGLLMLWLLFGRISDRRGAAGRHQSPAGPRFRPASTSRSSPARSPSAAMGAHRASSPGGTSSGRKGNATCVLKSSRTLEERRYLRWESVSNGWGHSQRIPGGPW